MPTQSNWCETLENAGGMSGVRFRIDNDAGFAWGRYVGNAAVERFIDRNMAVKQKTPKDERRA
jgi:hypothetical protein